MADEEADYQGLYKALASGACCPHYLERLILYNEGLARLHANKVVETLSDALATRTETGGSMMKGLEVGGGLDYPRLLSSSGFDALEDLQLRPLHGDDSSAMAGLAEWVSRTKAVHLQTLCVVVNPGCGFSLVSPMVALCQGNVAPGLRSLSLTPMGDNSTVPLIEAIERGTWPHLTELDLNLELFGVQNRQRFMDALLLGAPDVRTLRLRMPIDMHVILARALGDGACPQLEELDLSGCPISLEGMKELATVLEQSPPCAATLRRLKLRDCDMTRDHCKVLA